MWALYGYIDRGCYTCPDDTVELVALFSAEKKAQDYVKRSKLKKTSRQGYVFHSKSLLRNYTATSIEVYEQPNYPVDPEV